MIKLIIAVKPKTKSEPIEIPKGNKITTKISKEAIIAIARYNNHHLEKKYTFSILIFYLVADDTIKAVWNSRYGPYSLKLLSK